MLWITDTFDLVSDYIYILLNYSNNITLLLTKILKQKGGNVIIREQLLSTYLTVEHLF